MGLRGCTDSRLLHFHSCECQRALIDTLDGRVAVGLVLFMIRLHLGHSIWRSMLW
jgi:hypothetical protein